MLLAKDLIKYLVLRRVILWANALCSATFNKMVIFTENSLVS